KVNFDKFAKLAPEFVPQITIKQTIINLIQGLDDMDFRNKDFRNSNLIRLNRITNLKEKKLLDNNLRWIS
ncbi:MAG: NAD-dependent epimerase, partial [Nanoarchaeota archaeon]